MDSTIATNAGLRNDVFTAFESAVFTKRNSKKNFVAKTYEPLLKAGIPALVDRIPSILETESLTILRVPYLQAISNRHGYWRTTAHHPSSRPCWTDPKRRPMRATERRNELVASWRLNCIPRVENTTVSSQSGGTATANNLLIGTYTCTVVITDP